MTIAAGVRLGPYEIVAPLGAGGMGACGHAPHQRRISVSSRRGWGPAASERMLTIDQAGLLDVGRPEEHGLLITPDGDPYAYKQTRVLKDLYLVDGLK
jgi:hypothetical protein